MQYDFELLQKARSINNSLLSLWVAPRISQDLAWRDLCGKYDAAFKYWNGTSTVSGSFFVHGRNIARGHGAMECKADASDRRKAEAWTGGGIIISRGLAIDKWTISAFVNVDTANARAGGRAIYAERASTGQDILKLDSLDTGFSSNRFGFTIRNDAGIVTQFFPSLGKNIISNTWNHVAATMNGGTITLYVNGTSSSATHSHANYTNSGIESWIGSDKGDTNATTIGYLDAVSIHTECLNAAQIESWRQLFLNRITSFDRRFPYELLVGESPVAATFQPAWASQRSKIIGTGVS